MKHAVFAAGLIVALATPAFAHHSGAMFAADRNITVEGTVKQYQFTMPHTWISIVTAPDASGKTQNWDIEGGGVTGMKRVGLTPDVVKPGVKMSMVIHPLKDGRNGGSLVSANIGGKEYTFGYANNPYGTGRTEEDGGAKARVR